MTDFQCACGAYPQQERGKNNLKLYKCSCGIMTVSSYKNPSMRCRAWIGKNLEELHHYSHLYPSLADKKRQEVK